MVSTDKPLQAIGLPMGRFVFHQDTEIELPWMSVTAVALGEGAVRAHLLVEEGGVPRLRLELRYSRPEASRLQDGTRRNILAVRHSKSRFRTGPRNRRVLRSRPRSVRSSISPLFGTSTRRDGKKSARAHLSLYLKEFPPRDQHR
jgi:hypothetical protein